MLSCPVKRERTTHVHTPIVRDEINQVICNGSDCNYHVQEKESSYSNVYIQKVDSPPPFHNFCA